MADVLVTCITKPQNGSHEHITHIGNPKANWKWSVEEVVKSIEANTNTFYVQDAVSGKKAYIGVVKSAGHAPYLRTHADGNWNNNLLSLPSCA